MGLLDRANDLGEESTGAAVSGDDGELSAPGGDGFGDAVKKTLILMEGEFVEGNMAALAGESIGIGGEGKDAAAIGELEDIGGGVGIAIEQDLAVLGAANVQEISPVAA